MYEVIMLDKKKKKKKKKNGGMEGREREVYIFIYSKKEKKERKNQIKTNHADTHILLIKSNQIK